MKGLNLIIMREYYSRVRTKAFIITTLLTPLIMIATIILPTIIATMKVGDIETVYVIDKTNSYMPFLKDTKSVSFVSLKDDSENTAKGKNHALLQINADLSTKPNALTFYSEMQKPPTQLLNYIEKQLSEAVKNKRLEDFSQKSSIDNSVTEGILDIVNTHSQININTYRWSSDGEVVDTVSQMASMIGYGFTFIMFMFVMMYGSIVMQSVVEEKTNRIVEVIVSSVKPFTLMMGKIIAIGMMGITQIIFWIFIVGLGFFIYSKFGISASLDDVSQAAEVAQNNKILSSMIGSQMDSLLSINWVQIIICFILYFVGGYLLYASLFAMFSSAANDSQEVQQFATPLTMVLFVAFYIGFGAARDPESTMSVWASIIPFTSPIVMMVRTPFEVPFWHMLLSVVLLYATAFFFTYLAGRIYRVGILMYGKKTNFMEIFKWLKYK